MSAAGPQHTEERLGGLPEPAPRDFVAGRWGLDTVLFVAAAMFMSVAVLHQLFGDEDAPIWQLAALQTPGFVLGFALGFVVARYVDKRGPRAVGLAPPGASRFLRGIALYVPLGAIWWAFVLVHASVLQLVGVELPEPTLEASIKQGLSGWPLVVTVIATCVGAPLGEEMLFRGLLHGWLRRSLAFAPAAVIGGVLFGAVHFTQIKLIPMIVLGVMLAYVRERGPGLWGCVGFRATHNALTLLLLTIGAA